MALYDNCMHDIVEFSGLNLIMEFLNEKPNDYMNNSQTMESEMSACERVQQKSAIALSLFSKNLSYVKILIELKGNIFFFFVSKIIF
jgi:hypothetical protein